jgi:hypothetical protein
VLVLKNRELSTPELPPGIPIVLMNRDFALLVLLVVKNACAAANYTLAF